MNQRMIFLVSALLLAAPLAGAAQQLKPNELPTNVSGVTTIAAPPAAFNPFNASDQDLEYYGFPPRPNEIAAPKAFASWQKAMTASKIPHRAHTRSHEELCRSGEDESRRGHTDKRYRGQFL